MTSNTKERSLELAGVARTIAEQHPEHVTQGGKLLPLAKEMMDATDCSVDTAKRHIARALRLMRGELVRSEWGGKRDGAGFPAGVKRSGRRGKAL